MTAQATPPSSRVLLFSEDAEMRAFLEKVLAEDHELVMTSSEDDLLAELRRSPGFSLVLLDHAAGDAQRAFDLKEKIVECDVALPVAMMMESGDEEAAVEALRRGFADYISKRQVAVQSALLRRRVAANVELATLKRENRALNTAIVESQQRLFNIYDSLDDAIMQIDEECNIVSLNRSAAALANCEPPEAVGKACHELFCFSPCEARAKKDACHIYSTFAEGETLRGERQDEKTGSTYQYMTFITELNGEEYTVYRETDITEKRRLERRIREALQSLGVNEMPEEN